MSMSIKPYSSGPRIHTLDELQSRDRNEITQLRDENEKLRSCIQETDQNLREVNEQAAKFIEEMHKTNHAIESNLQQMTQNAEDTRKTALELRPKTFLSALAKISIVAGFTIACLAVKKKLSWSIE